VEEYDPAADTWTSKASMASTREGLAAAAVNNKIYAIGGHDGSTYLATVEEYDPAADTWTSRASMAAPRTWLAAAAVDNKIYAIGGSDGSTYLTTVEECSPPVTYYVHEKS
jgi:N-acetylneuraminic acid mutarotase